MMTENYRNETMQQVCLRRFFLGQENSKMAKNMIYWPKIIIRKQQQSKNKLVENCFRSESIQNVSKRTVIRKYQNRKVFLCKFFL